MVTALTLLIASTVSGALAAPAPDFFGKMVGHWTATGSRHQSLSGRETRIEMDTQTSVQNETLVSENIVKEVDVASGRVRLYGTAFWMRAQDSTVVYLGSGTDAEATPPSSSGKFENGTLTVTQDFGGDYVIRSESEFTADPTLTHYREFTYHGEILLSETALEYRKVD